MGKWKLPLLTAFLGKAWSSLLLFLATPLYIHFIGIEAYGLVGFFQSLLILSNLMEFGLGTTLNREVATLSENKESDQTKQNLVFTLEIVYWVLAAVVGITAWIMSPWLARFWFHSETLDVNQLHHSLIYIGLAIAFQMPMYIYSSGLMGLHKQIPLNVVNIIASSIRVVATILILAFVTHSIKVFFITQGIASLLHTLLLRQTLWQYIREKTYKPRFCLDQLKRIWKFSLGVTGIYFTSLALTQTDKLLISKFLSLQALGYYSVAALLSQGLYTFINPIFSVFFPKFSECVASDNLEMLTQYYHKSCKIMAAVLFPIAATMCCFAEDVLYIWTRNPEIVSNSSYVMIFLILGTMLNGAVNIPYALQLAFGWVKFSLYQNLLALIFSIPLLLYLVSAYGVIGASITWFLVNLGFALISIPLMHRKLLPLEKKRWFIEDFLKPLLLAMFVAFTCRLFFPYVSSIYLRLAKLGIVYTMSCLLTLSLLGFKLFPKRIFALVQKT